MAEVPSTVFRKNTEYTRLSPLYIYNTAHILRPGTPVFRFFTALSTAT